ncbi:MAG: SDR family NAD(P)-dependent oxidoreductase [Planctomycetota bacterium]
MKKGIRTLEGTTWVITGAASGIGLELTLQALAQGARVALVDRDAAGLERALAASGAPERCSTHAADVSDRGVMLALPEAVLAQHPRVDVLVNNAGVGYEGAFGQTSLETWDHVMGVNFWGVVHGLHAFLPHLAKAPRAHVVNLSSLFGIVGMPGQTAYCASKYAVRGLSECLWEELRPTTVGLTVVHPGSVATNIMKTSDGDDPELMAKLAEWYDAHAMAPRKAAKKIVKAVRKGKPRLRIAPEAFLADYVKRLLPVWGNRLISDLVIRGLGLSYMREVRSEQWERTMVRGDGP